MPHLRLIEPDDATGPLKDEYDAAVGRAGKVFNIVKAMSLRPAVLNRSMELYGAIMFEPSGLTRDERELLATVTSQRLSLLNTGTCRRPPCRGRRRRARTTRSARLSAVRSSAAD